MGLLARSARSSLAGEPTSRAKTGYISEFLELVLVPYLDLIIKKKVKVVTNAGGLDPTGLKDAIVAHLEKRGLDNKLTVAAVTGDDITSQKDSLLKQGAFEDFDPLSGAGSKEDGISDTTELLSLNAYLGAQPITEALSRGADIVVTGRCVDSALVVGPLAFEYDWDYSTTQQESLDRLAAASLAGHIVECGSQATGGNYTDWRASAFTPHGGWANMGYPILTFNEDASFAITKPKRTGGVVDTKGISEQMLYEVLDPENYILPDVVLDMSSVRLEQVEPNVVVVHGAKGKAPTPWLKCTAVEQMGYRLTVDILVCGIEAESKAKVLGKAMIDRTNAIAAARYIGVKPISAADSAVHLIGAESTLDPKSRGPERREIALRVAARHANRAVLDILGKESAPFLTNSCPGICMLTSGRPKSSPNFVARSVLVRRDVVISEVHVGNEASATRLPLSIQGCEPVRPAQCRLQIVDGLKPGNSTLSLARGLVKLHDIAIGRSGDKGDTANVAIIARDPSFYPYILDQLTPDVIFSAFEHLVAPGGSVTRFEIPGIYAVNFVITKSLGGGGLSSLRLDR